MDVALYTGNGSTQTISGLNFSPDLIWTKSRSQAYSHNLYDSVRGIHKNLFPNETSAENTDTNTIQAFNSDGFQIGSNDNGNYTNGGSAVAWTWDAGSSTVTNTAGSITSQVRTNGYLSIVTYTGTGSNATVGHGLGVAPQMLIVKSRSNAENWCVYHQSVGNTAFLKLDTTGGSASFNAWASTTPTSTVFSVGNIGETNTNGGTYVCYAFAPVAGYSSMSSYVGNGSSDGVFVYTGMRPRWILIKSTGTQGWYLWDSSRDPYNAAIALLSPNNSNAESVLSNHAIDLVSNGFKIRDGNTAFNQSGQSFIYVAFAESPFAYARAR
jgi:hypothetical protein